MAKGKKTAGKKADGARRDARAKPTKDETVEVKQGVQLLLANLPSDKDALYHYENILQHAAKAKTASANLGSAKKKAKEAGIDVSAIMETMKLERMDPLDLASKLKEQARLMDKRGLPIQMGLYETAYKSVEEQAYDLGFKDGVAGRSMNTKLYKEGGPGYEDYARGWRAGQAKNQAKIKAPDEPPAKIVGKGGAALKVVGGADSPVEGEEAEETDWA